MRLAEAPAFPVPKWPADEFVEHQNGHRQRFLGVQPNCLAEATRWLPGFGRAFEGLITRRPEARATLLPGFVEVAGGGEFAVFVEDGPIAEAGVEEGVGAFEFFFAEGVAGVEDDVTVGVERVGINGH